MTGDKSAKDTARDPERGALGPVRRGIRAAAKKAAKKVVKKAAQKAAQKKTATKTTSAARTTKKTAKAATRREKPASGTVAAASRTGSARASTAGSAAPRAAGTGTDAAVESAGIPSAASSPETGPTFEAPRPPAPMHPGASLDSMHEHAGGFRSMLALWGPLIIVGFLVLVFRGGGERTDAVAVGSDATAQATAGAPEASARGPWTGDAAELAAGAPPAQRMPGSPGAGRGAADAFDNGFTMRTSMASPSFAGGGPGARMPASGAARLYPSPPGPYRDTRYRGLPTGESWSTSSSGEWRWPADGPGGPGYEDGGEQPAQWVRCAPPYYWCPAPSKPAW